MDINLAKLEKLINGDMLPETRADELFILAYKAGIGDELLLLTMLDLRDIFEQLESHEKDFFILGFCLGQKQFREVEEVSLESIINDKPNKTH